MLWRSMIREFMFWVCLFVCLFLLLNVREIAVNVRIYREWFDGWLGLFWLTGWWIGCLVGWLAVIFLFCFLLLYVCVCLCFSVFFSIFLFVCCACAAKNTYPSWTGPIECLALDSSVINALVIDSVAPKPPSCCVLVIYVKNEYKEKNVKTKTVRPIAKLYGFHFELNQKQQQQQKRYCLCFFVCVFQDEEKHTFWLKKL